MGFYFLKFDLDIPVKSLILSQMKTQWRVWCWTSLLAGGLLSPLVCHAAPPAVREEFTDPVAARAERQPSAFKDIPLYAFPGRFLFSGTYYTHLSLTEMRIDHVAINSRCTRQNRTFMISAGYLAPIGNRLGAGRFEVPFLSADSFQVSRLAPASVGDYVVHLSNDYVYSASAQLFLTARF